MITIEDKHRWAAEEAERLRECIDLIEVGEMVAEPMISKDAEIVEAIAADYRRCGDQAALALLGKRAEVPAFLLPQGKRADSAEDPAPAATGELPGMPTWLSGAGFEHTEPVVVDQASPRPTVLILIGAAALAASLIGAWQADRIIADWYYAGALQE